MTSYAILPFRRALEARTIFAFWTEHNPMSANRVRALGTISANSRCNVEFLDANRIALLRKRVIDLHPAYDYLSATHKSDYLRCYFMHQFGGGYTDIKETTKDWNFAFDALLASDAFGVGYTEISAEDVAPVSGTIERTMKRDYRSLIGNCAYIFRPDTLFTQEWISLTTSLLDKKHPLLRENPASHPQDYMNARLSNGVLSRYPMRWTELLGNIFHPLVFKNKKKILHCDIQPELLDYH
ncbi:hypothetical protein V1T76_08730 [Roseibium sp. FZY0029]|uniref:hypothetical protein n=1 Tax=Roseibium sp. FZY0029 TaxID=3116647 RepID=UPI002E9EBFA7|nr:hypothetical protein [Roseibium sp. FZY0029]